ncbi:MAG: hypothetical protein IT318_11240 [Anaerolineales bacterium]|nr:hypothetical protein [Anaerolineales bacterium]
MILLLEAELHLARGQPMLALEAADRLLALQARLEIGAYMARVLLARAHGGPADVRWQAQARKPGGAAGALHPARVSRGLPQPQVQLVLSASTQSAVKGLPDNSPESYGPVPRNTLRRVVGRCPPDFARRARDATL